jgi:hypothetical protein
VSEPWPKLRARIAELEAALADKEQALVERLRAERNAMHSILVRAEELIEQCDGTCGDDVSFLDEMAAALWPGRRTP